MCIDTIAIGLIGSSHSTGLELAACAAADLPLGVPTASRLIGSGNDALGLYCSSVSLGR